MNAEFNASRELSNGVYENLSVEKLPRSEVKISGRIKSGAIPRFYRDALNALKAKAELPGFRRGKVPENVIEERLGEEIILKDAAELAVQSVYPEMLAELKIRPLGNPELRFTKINKQELEFQITLPVFPDFDLPDYQRLAKETKKPETQMVTDEEVEKSIEAARKEHRHAEFHKHAKTSRHDTPDHPSETLELPPLSEEEAKKLAPVKDIPELKEKVKLALKAGKERQVVEKRRVAILDSLIAATKMELPAVLIAEELDRMEREFGADLGRLSLNLPEYMKRTGKTLGQLREEWRPSAENRSKLELILASIAEKEGISATDEEIKEEVGHLRTHHQNAPEEALRLYVSRVLRHQKVLEFLERE